MYNKSINELYNIIRKKGNNSVIKYFLNRINKYNNKLRCFSFVNNNEYYYLNYNFAIPFAHKNIYCIKGLRISCSSNLLNKFIINYNSTIEKLLEKKNFISIGNINLDEFAMGDFNKNNYYDLPKNPWLLFQSPGGSSGGSASAVAARMIPFASGSDTGGSIRLPSSYCGTTGIKPTYSIISRYGMIVFSSSLDTPGIIAKSAEDCFYLLKILYTVDYKDSIKIFCEYTKLRLKNKRKLIIGLPIDFISKFNKDFFFLLHDVQCNLKSFKFNYIYVNLYNDNLFVHIYNIISSSECCTDLSMLNSLIYGYLNSDINICEYNKFGKYNYLGIEVNRRIIFGGYLLSNNFYLKSKQIVNLIKDNYINILNKVDFIMLFVFDLFFFNIDCNMNFIDKYFIDVYICGINLAGLPSITFPIGFIINRPIGIQLIGSKFSEYILLDIVIKFQNNTNWHKIIPRGFDVI